MTISSSGHVRNYVDDFPLGGKALAASGDPRNIPLGFCQEELLRDGKNQVEKPRGRVGSVFGGEMATAKYYSPLDGLDRRNGHRAGILFRGGNVLYLGQRAN